MDVYSLLTKRPSKPTISTINNSTSNSNSNSTSSNSTNINTNSSNSNNNTNANTNTNNNVPIQSNTNTNSNNNDQQSVQKEKDYQQQQLQNQQPCLVIGHSSSSNNKSNQIHKQNKLNNVHQRILKKSHWKNDCEFLSCYSCSLPFTLFTRRRHHCRICGFVFCFEFVSNFYGWIMELPCLFPNPSV